MLSILFGDQVEELASEPLPHTVAVRMGVGVGKDCTLLRKTNIMVFQRI